MKRFFSIQFWNILQFTKAFFDNMCVLSYKKVINGSKSIFHKYDEKTKHFTKFFVSVFKNAKNSIFEHTNIFFGKMFYYFFIVFMKNAFETISWFFYKTKRTCYQQKFLITVKYFKIWLKNTFFSMLVQKKFFGAEFDPKTFKKTKFSIKKHVFSDFFL